MPLFCVVGSDVHDELMMKSGQVLTNQLSYRPCCLEKKWPVKVL